MGDSMMTLPLDDSKPVDKRVQQCYEVIMAGLKHYEFPLGQEMLVISKSDRCYFQSAYNWMPHAMQLCYNGTFGEWNYNFDHKDPEAVVKHTAVFGTRARQLRWSMQIVFHYSGIVEIDYDSWNPDYGVAPATLHFFSEVVAHMVTGGVTNPYDARKGLIKAWKIDIPLIA